jgi:hypothetical protein
MEELRVADPGISGSPWQVANILTAVGCCAPHPADHHPARLDLPGWQAGDSQALVITGKRSDSLDERHREHHGSRRRDRMTITTTTRA